MYIPGWNLAFTPLSWRTSAPFNTCETQCPVSDKEKQRFVLAIDGMVPGEKLFRSEMVGYSPAAQGGIQIAFARRV